MIKRIYIIAAVVLILAICGILVFYNFEIVPGKKWLNPSEEYYQNSFLGLERWLKETGHYVNHSFYFLREDIEDITERMIILPAWRSFWDYTDEIKLWIEQGGYLFLHIDRHRLNEDFDVFLSDFGLKINKERLDVTGPNTDIVYPRLDGNINFIVENEENAYIEYDNASLIRLVDVPYGNGRLTVTGTPFFLYNRYIKEEVNALLAWKLTGERLAQDEGVLIIRQQGEPVPENSIIGTIWKRGNLVPLLVSAFVLIFIGFWMTIPVFGLVSYDKQRNSRPIKDRFTAEIKFLKKQNALTYYLEVYARENKRKIVYEKEDSYSYRDLINQYRRLFNGTTKI
ncbi:MAG: hypothetical protein FWC01_05585 [Treponema sp.]|nr:hypothetical protein [Treponema sp.]MCL2237337.1 hypothetical protein [Treponema sp.]